MKFEDRRKSDSVVGGKRLYFYDKEWYVRMRKYMEKKFGRELERVGVGDDGWVRSVFESVMKEK